MLTQANQDNRNSKQPNITNKDIENKFKDITLEDIYLHMNLHAKLYFNEKKAIVTSLNITQSSIDNKNIEIGYLLEEEDGSERNKLLSDFYYPVLINPQSTNKDGSITIEKRKSYLNKNLNKLVADIKISIDDNGEKLIVHNNNYEIKVEIIDDGEIYGLYFHITINNECYRIENLHENIYNECSDELLVLNQDDKNITMLYKHGVPTQIYPKHLLLENCWFGAVNTGLFHLIRILEKNKKC